MWETRSTVGSTVPRQTDLDCVRKQPENEPVSSVPPRFCFSACPSSCQMNPFFPMLFVVVLISQTNLFPMFVVVVLVRVFFFLSQQQENN